MTTNETIRRYVLVAGSLLIALGAFYQPSVQGYEPDTVTAKALQCLVYGFMPAAVGYVAARIHRGMRAAGAPDRYYRVWHLWWGVMLLVLAAGGGHFGQLADLLSRA